MHKSHQILIAAFVTVLVSLACGILDDPTFYEDEEFFTDEGDFFEEDETFFEEEEESFVDATTGESSTLAGSPDLRQISFGSLSDGDSIDIEIQPGDVSFLFTAVGEDPTDYVYISRVDGPVNNIYEYDWFADELNSEQLDEAVWAVGEVSVYLPVAPQFDIEPGTYTITVGTDFGSNISEAYAIIRSGDINARQAIDINYWLVESELVLYSQGELAEVESIVRADMNRLLNQQNLEVGRIAFIPASDDVIRRYDVVRNQGDDDDLREACRAMNEEVGFTTRAANIIVVESITAPAEGIGPGDIAGVSLGRPGSFMAPNSAYNCTFVAIDGFYDFGTNEFGHTSIHELAHALSLPHTTEADGQYFDLFTDTPECPIDNDTDGSGEVDPEECADGTNFMFWTGEAFSLSADQAWVLRRHPVFYTAP